jgi:hypothetical protein
MEEKLDLMLLWIRALSKLKITLADPAKSVFNSMEHQMTFG